MMDNEHKITLDSGISFDFTNLFGVDRLTPEDVKTMHEKIAAAQETIKHLRQTGEIAGHLSKDGTPEHVYFTRLPYVQEGYPNTKELLDSMIGYGQKIRSQCDAVIFCGIGGSYLGGKVLYDSFTSELWNHSKEQGAPLSKVYFTGNSLDVDDMEAIWKELKVLAEAKVADGKKLNVCMVAISKSGTTLETLSAFLYFYEQFQKEEKCFKLEVAVVTDKTNKTGPFNILSAKNGWALFDLVEGIGGRFSVLSTPGLIVAAILGMDLHQLLDGAKDMDKACQGSSLSENPALANAVYKYLAFTKYGCNIEVMMPYGIKMQSLGNWYIQLLAESLGKRKNKKGEEVFYGRTPTIAVGTTDMHSQTQLHQEGRRDKVVQFIALGNAEGRIVLHNCFPEISQFKNMEGLDVNKALLIALHANEEALTSDNRFNACYYLPKMNEYVLGQIFYYLMLSIAYEGEFANVDAFDQPGVEIYKRIMKKHL